MLFPFALISSYKILTLNVKIYQPHLLIYAN